MLIRLEDLHLVGEEQAGTENVWPGTVRSVLYLGSYWECMVEVNGHRLKTQVPRRRRPTEGENVLVHVPARYCYRLPEAGETIVDDDVEEPMGVDRSAAS